MLRGTTLMLMEAMEALEEVPSPETFLNMELHRCQVHPAVYKVAQIRISEKLIRPRYLHRNEKL
jgi:hypothetical protein